MKIFVYILINLLILGLFYYSKLTPHKDKLCGNYKKLYDVLYRILNPILNLLGRISKPVQVGTGLSMDMSQIILLIILLFSIRYIL